MLNFFDKIDSKDTIKQHNVKTQLNLIINTGFHNDKFHASWKFSLNNAK